MLITVKRTGGFAGLSEEVARVDTARLSQHAAQQVQQAVQRLGFFELPTAVAPEALGADLLQYQISIEDGGREHRVSFYQDEAPGTEPLLKFIDLLAEVTVG